MVRSTHRVAAPNLSHLLYVPEVVGTRSDWPVVVFLHGSGERGHDLDAVRKYGLPRYLEAGRSISAFVVAPQCPAGQTWETAIPQLEAMLDRVVGAHPVAAKRIALTGFSMGGFGAWAWALQSPTRIASLVCVAGSRRPGSERMREYQLKSLRETSIWLIHGAADVHVPVEGTDALAAELEERGTSFRYTRYPDADHGETCRRAYDNPEMLAWLVAHPSEQTSSHRRHA